MSETSPSPKSPLPSTQPQDTNGTNEPQLSPETPKPAKSPHLVSANYSPPPPPDTLITSTLTKKIKLQRVDPVPLNEDDDELAPLLGQSPLDPGDPKVLPLNLYNVRFLKRVTHTLVVINTVFTILEFFSGFVSIPGFYNRGLSFYELDLFALSLVTNLLSLWKFDVPSQYERQCGYIQIILILINVVVIITVPGIRDSLQFLGAGVTLWFGLNVGFDAFASYYVEKGRNYQEMRLVGRVELRRLISELLTILVKLLVKLLLLIIVVLLSIKGWLNAFDTHEKPWGNLVLVQDDKFRVHVSCSGISDSAWPGKGANPDKPKPQQPIILLEGGQHTSSEVFQEWVEELHNLNKIDRYCIWDRPGYAFSDLAPSPALIGITVEYLVEALEKLGVDGPFSLVGYDSGGLYSRMFALRKPGQTHLMLLVDAWHQDLLKNDPFSGPNHQKEPLKVFNGIFDPMNTWTGVKLWFKGVVSPLGIITDWHWLIHPQAYSSKNRIYGKDMRYGSRYLRARLQEQTTLSILSYNEVNGADMHDIPLAVISSDFMIKKSMNWGRWQRQLTKISNNCIEWVIAENSGHDIWKLVKGRKQLQDLLLRLIEADDR